MRRPSRNVKSLQSNQCIVALEPSANDQSNSLIRSTYPTPIIQDPTMQITDPIVTKSCPNSVAEKITKKQMMMSERECRPPFRGGLARRKGPPPSDSLGWFKTNFKKLTNDQEYEPVPYIMISQLFFRNSIFV